MRPVIVKVYGFLVPATKECLTRLQALDITANDEDVEVFTLDNGLLNISFEGVYFPQGEVLEILTAELGGQSKGKLDYIDVEGWTLERHSISGKNIEVGKRSLNNILEFSGH